MKNLKKIGYALLIIGGLNWGFVGLFQTDLVAKFFGDMSMVSRLIYALVGISALIILTTRCGCKGCNGSKCCK